MGHGKTFDGRYSMQRLLGRGTHSEVWLAHDDQSYEDVALKIYSPSSGLNDEGLDIFSQEFAMMTKQHQENLLVPIRYGQSGRKPYIVLPYCSKGCAAKRIGLFQEAEIWKLIYDVAKGLEALHGMRPPIIHQNIKPDNILINQNGDYILTDFYLSQRCKNVLRKITARVHLSASASIYKAPESNETNMPIMANDIYSLGVTAYELLTGDTPFTKERVLDLNKNKKNDKFSTNLRHLIELCLSKEPWERPSATDLVKLAEKGMKGGKIPKSGRKSNKGIMFMLALSCIIIVSIPIGGKFLQDRQIEQENTATKVMQNDSVNIIYRHLNAANKFYRRAIAKEEFYDSLLIKAHQEYMKALSVINESSSMRILNLKNVAETGLATVNQQLQTAYKEMKDKAEYFKDEPAVKTEFENRANNIAKTINKKKK